LYVSSTRVYDGAEATGEGTRIGVLPGVSDPYVSSKIAGECAVLAASPRALVARLSNVAGPSVRSGLFLSDILRQAARDGTVQLRSALTSSKDYVDVRDAAAWTVDLALAGAPRILNLAAGRNLEHGELLDALARVAPLRVVVAEGSPEIIVPSIDAGLAQVTFPRALRDPLVELPGYFKAFQAAALPAIRK
jgi:dTDP-4-dehydrorhamnose reductase